MLSPFPGMDPFVESQRWKDFHAGFLSELSALLVNSLRPRYEVLVEEDVYVEYGRLDPRHTLQPDSSLAGEPTRPRTSGGTLLAFRPGVARVRLPELLPDEERHSYLEIRRLPDRQLVTVVELLSPTNKMAGDKGRGRYEEKRRDLISSQVNIVEIDLLRGGTRLAMGEPLPPSDYYVFVSRAEDRPYSSVTPVALRDALPKLTLPLLPADPDVELGLQAVFDSTYERKGYDYGLRYDLPLLPPLPPEDERWIRDQVAAWRSSAAGGRG